MIVNINGIKWRIIFVSKYSQELIDRTGTRTLATTDPVTHTVYISNAISGGLLTRVVKHEMAHCIMVSHNLLDDIHEMVKPKYWIMAEEWICNFIADYSDDIWLLSNHIIRKRY